MTVDRQEVAPYQINVADIQDAVQRLQIPMDHGSFMGILEGFGDLPGVDYGDVHGLRAGKRLAISTNSITNARTPPASAMPYRVAMQNFPAKPTT
jgi:hypothetical protein